jgi:hypothetical protein
MPPVPSSFFFLHRVFLCSPNWPRICNLPASVSQVLGLHACSTTPGSRHRFLMLLISTNLLLLSFLSTNIQWTFFFFLFFFCGTGVWTQGLHLEPLHQPFLWFVLFCLFFQDRVFWTICPGWLPAAILLISASSVARITGMSYQQEFWYLWVIGF